MLEGLRRALVTAVRYDRIIKGFEKSGLWPLKPEKPMASPFVVTTPAKIKTRTPIDGMVLTDALNAEKINIMKAASKEKKRHKTIVEDEKLRERMVAIATAVTREMDKPDGSLEKPPKKRRTTNQTMAALQQSTPSATVTIVDTVALPSASVRRSQRQKKMKRQIDE